MDRTGLYIMVFIILLSTCSIDEKFNILEERLTAIQEQLKEK